jgi:tetratricopeptide (TPR) repeat protein
MDVAKPDEKLGDSTKYVRLVGELDDSIRKAERNIKDAELSKSLYDKASTMLKMYSNNAPNRVMEWVRARADASTAVYKTDPSAVVPEPLCDAGRRWFDVAVESWQRIVRIGDLPLDEALVIHAVYQCAKLYEEVGDIAKAVETITMAISIRPSDMLPLRIRAKLYGKQRMFREELKDRMSLVANNPTSREYADRGRVYMDLKMFRPAIDDYDMAIRKNKEAGATVYLWIPYLQKAHIYSEMGDYGMAMIQVDHVLNTVCPNSRYALAAKQEIQSKWDEFKATGIPRAITVPSGDHKNAASDSRCPAPAPAPALEPPSVAASDGSLSKPRGRSPYIHRRSDSRDRHKNGRGDSGERGHRRRSVSRDRDHERLRRRSRSGSKDRTRRRHESRSDSRDRGRRRKSASRDRDTRPKNKASSPVRPQQQSQPPAAQVSPMPIVTLPPPVKSQQPQSSVQTQMMIPTNRANSIGPSVHPDRQKIVQHTAPRPLPVPSAAAVAPPVANDGTAASSDVVMTPARPSSNSSGAPASVDLKTANAVQNPAPQHSDPKFPSLTATPEQVGIYLASIGSAYSPYRQCAIDNGLSGDMLHSILSEPDKAETAKILRDAGITNSIHVRVIMLNFRNAVAGRS